jgi:hypothetical protein
MTRKELDALREEYTTLVPADFIRGAFISKETLRAYLNKKRDCSGLFFYIIPDKSGKAKFTMHLEPFDADIKRYVEEIIITKAGQGLLEEESLAKPCPPYPTCPN